MLATTKLVPLKPRLFQGSDEISYNISTIYLEVTIDKKLKFYTHVENATSKLAQNIA